MRAATATGVVAPVRGGALAGATVSLSVAAHGAAGGGVPTSSTLIVLTGLAAILASCASVVPALRRGTVAAVGVLSVGQVLGHLALSLETHHTVTVTAGMAAAHAAAVTVCAMLVGAADGVGTAVCAALRAVTAGRPAHPEPFAPVRLRPAGRPSRPLAEILCRTGLSLRGPPVLVRS
ncbi:hypothetical protein [Rhodococcus triatomae]|nr:hypothetical protein G419_03553 [Rhodococcus triatomae BKS 15-14]